MTASLVDRIAFAPRPFDAAKAEHVLRAVAEAGATPAAAAPLLLGVAGCSPYLARLMQREAPWLGAALNAAPEAAMRAILEETAALGAAAPSREALMDGLRRAKRRAALLIGLADIGRVWDVMEATGALSDFADAALGAALRWLLAQEARKGKLALDPENPLDKSGYAVIAMGKHGARELNYSSDIDVICLFDPEAWPPEEYAHVKDRFIRVTRDLVKTLADITDGYVFRVDLRLRPDPSSTPVCMDMQAAERYYESLGKNWERAAYIKARVCAGDLAAGQGFLQSMQPFVWRRYLDFAALEDVHAMKRMINAHKGHGAIAVAGHDVKLGRGGIREIEFFAQTQQLIAGGRDRSLRANTTLGALAALVDAQKIDDAARAEMAEAYAYLRTVEHRAQMIEDAQTHRIPDPVDRIACFMGFDGPEAFEAATLRRLHAVDARFRRLFETEATLADAAEGVDLEVFGPDGAPEAATRALGDLGFASPAAAQAVLMRWREGRAPATRSPRSRAKLARLTPVIVRKFSEAISPDHALTQFDKFIGGLPAGVQLFSLLESNPRLLEMFADIFGAAPRLADYMGRNSNVIDSMLDSAFFSPPPPRDVLAYDMNARLDRQADFERVLDDSRRWAKERAFNIGVQTLLGLAGAEVAGPAFSDVAETLLRALRPYAEEDFAQKYGPPPGEGAVVLAMGKLGGREMTASSDLDLIVVYDPAGVEASAGPKPLSATHYYARWTQKILSAITAPTTETAAYEVDMRLRPSGRAGPLATQIEAFERYQSTEAWTWEHMALTRARVVDGPRPLAARVEAVIEAQLRAPRDAEKTLRDALEMRGRINAANQADLQDPWRLKRTRGGLVDIEFIAQALLLTSGAAGRATGNTLVALAVLRQAGALKEAQADALSEALSLQHGLMQIERVALTAPLDPKTAAPGLKLALARAGGCDGFGDLEERLRSAQAGVRDVFVEVFGALDPTP